MKNKDKMYSMKWIAEWILAAAAITLSLIMFFVHDFGNSIVFYLTGIALVIYAIIRFVPLIKTTRNRWAIAVNAIEMFIDATVGVLVFISMVKSEDLTFIYNAFPFMIGGALYLRGLIYMVETCFFGTKTKKSMFALHMFVLTLGTWIMASYNSFTPDYFRIVFSIFLMVSGIASIGFGIVSFSKYRQYVTMTKPKKVKPEKEKEIKPEDYIPISNDEKEKDEEPTIVA